MLAYNELNKLLTEVQAEVQAAAVHGFLCGQACVSRSPDEELWREFLDVRSDDEAMVRECYMEIEVFLAAVAEDIRSPDLDFQLLLPDDNAPLEDRVNALSEWCYGFLNGYGVGTGSEDKPALSQECLELLDDFTRICRVDIDENSDDEDETALMELIEYVRIGTIMLYEDFSSFSSLENGSGVLH